MSTKSYLIVKEKKMMEGQTLSANSRVKSQLKEKHTSVQLSGV